ncbi:MAG: AAA family ATPase [Limisphaerales bacterium]
MKGAIDRIQIEGFKSIRQADIRLNALNILIGPNGVGKSNFIGLFKLVNHIIERRLQVYVGTAGGAGSLLHFGRKRTPGMKVEFTFSDAANGYACELMATDEDQLIFADESTWFHDKRNYSRPYTSGLGGGHRETRLLDATGNPGRGIAGYVVSAMQSWRIYHFHDTSPEARVKQPCELHDNRVLKGDASNLAAFLYLLRQQSPAHYRNIVDAVKMVAPFLDDLVLEPLALNQQQIRLEWREKGNDHVFGPGALSDGTLRFLCLATLLLQPHLPSTILLDEPELGLHPYAITLLAELIRAAATKTQVIASTQSVSLVNQFEPNDVLIVEREDGQSVFKRLEPGAMTSWLEDYGLGDLWEKNLLGGRP